MINMTDIIQQTIEWHEVKHAKIGGTLSKGLFTKGDDLFFKILSERIEPFDPDEIEDFFENKAMQRGNDLEPLGLEYLEEYTGLKFNSTGWLQSEENELIGISPDGITEDLKILAEIKCPGAKKHTETIYNNCIPNDNLNQVLHSFIANKNQEKHYFISFRPESPKHFIKETTLDSIIDLGLKKTIEVEVIGKKGKPIKPKKMQVPDLKTVKEWRDIGINKADELLKRIKEAEKNIEF